MATTTLEKVPEVKEKAEQKCFYKPLIAIYENGTTYTVLVELPGADERALDVRVDKGVLTVQAPMRLDVVEGLTPIYSEMRLGDYRRSLEVSDHIDQDKIEATFKNGVLTLTMPKSKNAKAVRIPIKTV